mgnify:FL=1
MRAGAPSTGVVAVAAATASEQAELTRISGFTVQHQQNSSLATQTTGDGQLLGAGVAFAIVVAVREARLLAQQAQLRMLGSSAGDTAAAVVAVDQPLPSVALLRKLEAQERGLGDDGQLRARALREKAEKERQQSIERKLREAQAEERKEQRKQQVTSL